MKKPKKERLQEEWDMNRESLLSFLGEYHAKTISDLDIMQN